MRPWARRVALELFVAAVAALALSVAIAASADAAISFTAATTAATRGTGATTLSVSVPSGHAAGDVLVASVGASGTGSVTAPSGWTLIADTTAGSAIRQVSFFHVASAGEPSSYTFSLGTSRNASAGIADYRGVNTATPIDASGAATGISGNAISPSVTTSAVNATVLLAVSFAASETITADASTTRRYQTSSSGTVTGAGDFVQASAGATPTKSATPKSSTASWVAQTIALRDASTGSLSISTTATPSFSANLDSGDQTLSFALPMTVTDTRSGANARLGWNVTVTSTQYSTGSHQLATGASSVTGVTSSCQNGGSCTTAANSIIYPVAVPAGASPPAAVKLVDAAAGSGMGLFTLTPTLGVTVPQNSYAGSYQSTITLSIVSGP